MSGGSLNTTPLSDVNAVRIDGPSKASSFAGWSVGCLGDVNNDGFDDVALGDYMNEKVYVVFGAEHFSPVAVDAMGDRGFTVAASLEDNGNFGYSLSGVGDINGDGFDDFALGAYTSPQWGSSVSVPGAAYVVWGGRQLGDEVDLAELEGSGEGFRIVGPTRQRDRLGISVSVAGDLNGDGKDDLIVGADGVSNTATGDRSGGAAVVYGSDSDATVYTDPTKAQDAVYTCSDGTVDAASSDCASTGQAQARGFWINGAAKGDSTGSAVASISDISGDGQAVCETTFDATGEAQLTARFGGSELFTESVSAARTLKVTAAPKPVPSKVKTSISASSIPTSWRYGTAMTFTATVSGAADLSGKLSLVVDGKTIKTVTLSKAGSAKFALTGTELTTGAHAVSLSYAGNASSLASSSTAVGRSVGKAKTVAKVSVSKRKSKKPKVTVRVTAGSATPTGTVNIYDGKKKIKTVKLKASDHGRVQVRLRKLGKKGKHKVRAVFVANSTFLKDGSNVVTFRKKKR